MKWDLCGGLAVVGDGDGGRGNKVGRRRDVGRERAGDGLRGVDVIAGMGARIEEGASVCGIAGGDGFERSAP